MYLASWKSRAWVACHLGKELARCGYRDRDLVREVQFLCFRSGGELGMRLNSDEVWETPVLLVSASWSRWTRLELQGRQTLAGPVMDCIRVGIEDPSRNLINEAEQW